MVMFKLHDLEEARFGSPKKKKYEKDTEKNLPAHGIEPWILAY
jgi:hypothetical protein